MEEWKIVDKEAPATPALDLAALTVLA